MRNDDLKLEARKANIIGIIVMLTEGSQMNVDVKAVSSGKESWPKDFFEVLVRKDWRLWVEALKKELAGWDVNDAVTVVILAMSPRMPKWSNWGSSTR